MKRASTSSSDRQRKMGKAEATETEDFVNFVSDIPSLQRMACISIAINLWTGPDIKERAAEYCSSTHNDRSGKKINIYGILEERVLSKLYELSLPNLVKIRVSEVIRPIGLQVLNLMGIEVPTKSLSFPLFSEQESYGGIHHFRDLFEIKNSVCWTTEGTVDEISSFKELISIKYEGKDLPFLFQLACHYCLEEQISKLWVQLPSDIRAYDFFCCPADYKHYIIGYWISVLRNEPPTFLSTIRNSDDIDSEEEDIYDVAYGLCVNMVTLSALNGNIFAVKYFWHKLTEVEKIVHIERWLRLILHNLKRTVEYQKYNAHTNILCFLLSQMGQNQQKEIFKVYSIKILRPLFFSWPFQRFLLLTIIRMLDHLQEDAYNNILLCIFEEMYEKKSTGDKEQLLSMIRTIWGLSSSSLKESFIDVIANEINYKCKRRNLFNLDENTFFIILDNAPMKKKVEIVYKVISDKLSCERDTFLSDWYNSFLSKAQLSDCDVNSLKKRVMLKSADNLCQQLIYSDKFEEIEHFLNWIDLSEHERNTFKERMKKVAEQFYEEWLSEQKFQTVQNCLNWCFESDSKIHSYKQHIALKFAHRLCEHKLSFCNFEAAEKLANWGFQSDCAIYSFKQNMMSKCADGFCEHWLLSGEYQAIEKLLNWGFQSNHEVDCFKKHVMLKCADSLCENWLRKNDFQSIDNMLNWGFSSSCDIIEYKQCVMSRIGDRICDEWLRECNLQAVDRFLNWCLQSSQDIGCFKQRLILHNANRLCSDFLFCENYESINKFLNWCFKSDSDINSYKRDVMSSSDVLVFGFLEESKFETVDSMLKWGFHSDCAIKYYKKHIMSKYAYSLCDKWFRTCDFQSIERLLSWGFQSENDINYFKQCVMARFADKFCELWLKKSCFKDVETLLHWGYKSKMEISTFKQRLMSRCAEKLCVDWLLKCKFQKVETFLRWGLQSNDDITSFKMLTMSRSADKLCKVWLRTCNLKAVEKCLHWVYPTHDEIKQFKNDLFISRKGIKMLLHEATRPQAQWEKMMVLMRWFSPFSCETVREFKHSLTAGSFKDYVSKNIQEALFDLLDRIVGKCVVPDCHIHSSNENCDIESNDPGNSSLNDSKSDDDERYYGWVRYDTHSESDFTHRYTVMTSDSENRSDS